MKKRHIKIFSIKLARDASGRYFSVSDVKITGAKKVSFVKIGVRRDIKSGRFVAKKWPVKPGVTDTTPPPIRPPKKLKEA